MTLFWLEKFWYHFVEPDLIFFKILLVKNAANLGQDNIELCKSDDSLNVLPDNSAAIYQNEKYPGYPDNIKTKCSKLIKANAGSHLLVYLTDAKLFPESNKTVMHE